MPLKVKEVRDNPNKAENLNEMLESIGNDVINGAKYLWISVRDGEGDAVTSNALYNEDIPKESPVIESIVNYLTEYYAYILKGMTELSRAMEISKKKNLPEKTKDEERDYISPENVPVLKSIDRDISKGNPYLFISLERTGKNSVAPSVTSNCVDINDPLFDTLLNANTTFLIAKMLDKERKAKKGKHDIMYG